MTRKEEPMSDSSQELINLLNVQRDEVISRWSKLQQARRIVPPELPDEVQYQMA